MEGVASDGVGDSHHLGSDGAGKWRSLIVRQDLIDSDSEDVFGVDEEAV